MEEQKEFSSATRTRLARGISEADAVLLSVLDAHPQGIRVTDLAIEVDRPPDAIRRPLRRLMSRGLARRWTYQDQRGRDTAERVFDTPLGWTSVKWKITEEGTTAIRER